MSDRTLLKTVLYQTTQVRQGSSIFKLRNPDVDGVSKLMRIHSRPPSKASGPITCINNLAVHVATEPPIY